MSGCVPEAAGISEPEQLAEGLLVNEPAPSVPSGAALDVAGDSVVMENNGAVPESVSDR